jgi:hypothetical protein
MIDMMRAREIAADWHSGQTSALYALSSSGHVDASGIVRECERWLKHDREAPELEELRDMFEPYAAPNHDLLYTDADGNELFAVDYFKRDQGDAPGSRYGTTWSEYTPVILAVARILAYSSGELTTDTLDHAASVVVNDHDDVADMIVSHGTDDEIAELDTDVAEDARRRQRLGELD